jgi:hypothetical protein
LRSSYQNRTSSSVSLSGTKEWKANKSNYPSGCSVYV